jgi:hypothetical protein
MENRIRDLEIKQAILENALLFAAEKLSLSVEELLVSAVKYDTEKKEQEQSQRAAQEASALESGAEHTDETSSEIPQPGNLPTDEKTINNSSVSLFNPNTNSPSKVIDPAFKPFQAKVLYNYHAQQDYEMTIIESEIITVLSIHGNGWWLGSRANGHQQGYFPGSYVDPLPVPAV